MADETPTPDSPTPGAEDARFRFSLSEDGMKLGVSRYFPPRGGEEPSVALLVRQVAEAGVDLPVDEEAARQVVDAIRRHGEIRRITLVRGIPAQEPRDGSLTALGNLDFPVFPGDRFARLRKARSAENGRTIDGRVLKPKGKFTPEIVEVRPGENVDFDAAEEAFVSRVWGLARLRDGELRVDPIPHISEDAITVTGAVHARDFRGDPLTPERLEKELRDLGVAIGIDAARLARLLAEAGAREGVLPDQVVTRGRYPVPGRDGWLEYLVSTRETAGIEDAHGRLDFRDRGSFPMVAPGQAIGRLHPPTQGEGGIDLYGKTIPAHAGRELVLHAGDNVTRLDDGATFQARAAGVVVMERGVLSVTECLVINGNVDLGSGNVDVEEGSVKIRGNILAGFRVTAPGHIFVSGSVESATVTAGGNVEVAGGILMPEGGRVTAGGDVTAGYAINAIIHAEGDVLVANEATNSLIRAGGEFVATRGQGIVQGGAVLAARGMEVNEVGSDLGVPTTVGVFLVREEDSDLVRERISLKQAMRKIDDALGKGSPEAILARTRPDKLTAVSELLVHRERLAAAYAEVSRELDRLGMERQAELSGVRIRVKRFLYPGATVKFGQRTRTFKSRTEASTIYWDEEIRGIVVR
ncbi:FapA family protein [Pseudodesulfovibrio sp.]|uniref:FapA family protein n=1 Tax=Pseudodesulfovibrio sp. TaxID=2035812 RepID=UPI002613150B|nr:FapA family protein [Pseudodesulfovibrio sp.]MDD3311131.1 FapA family protein [Pseudodesulfovibrio sp.]